MHVVMIPSWFPQQEDPLLGIFFQEQGLALQKLGLHVGVVYPEVRPLKQISLPLLSLNHFQTTVDHSCLPTLRLHGWNFFPKWVKKQMQAWVFFADRLFSKYVSLYGKPDLIHAHSLLWGGLAATSLHKKWDIPFLVTEHRNHFIERIALKKNILNCWTFPYIQEASLLSTYMIGVSREVTEALKEYGGPITKYLTIPNSVDTDFFKPIPSKKRKDRYQFISIAQLEERKNLPMLLRCFQRILAKRPDVFLVILGEGEEREKLERLIQELGIQGRVSMPGKVSRREVRDALAESHAFLFSSNSESFGVALIEAFAAGLPVLSTRCGGPEHFIDSARGLLVPKEDEEAFFHGMRTIMDHAFDLESIRRFAIDNFHDTAIAHQMKSLYEKAL